MSEDVRLRFVSEDGLQRSKAEARGGAGEDLAARKSSSVTM